ncbi:tetratricopeptide repeat protein [Kolteria novifilia]
MSLVAPTANTAESPTLSFKDHFERDTRSNYVTAGEVTWAPGSLVLPPNAAVGTRFAGALRVAVRTRVEIPESSTVDQAVTHRFYSARGGDLAVTFISRARDSGGASGFLVQRLSRDSAGQDVVEELGRFATKGESIGGEWRLEFRRGLLEVARGEREAFVYDQALAEPIVGVAVMNRGTGVLECRQFDFEAFPEPILDDEAKERLRQADDLLVTARQEANRGDSTSAIADAQRAIWLRSRTLSEDHLTVADGLVELGRIFYVRGDLGRALDAGRQALKVRQATLGEHHPEATAGLIDVALYHKTLRQFDTAGRLYERALEQCREVLGERHQRTAVCLDNLAGLHVSLGRLAEARGLREQALAIFQTTLGPYHPESISCLHNLASLRHAQGKRDDALALYREALAGGRRLHGEHNAEVATMLENLSQLQLERGDWRASRRFAQECMSVRTSLFGKEHPATRRIESLLAKIDREEGRSEPN